MDEKIRKNKIKEVENTLSEIDRIVIQTRKNYPESKDRDDAVLFLTKARTFYSTQRTKLHSDENI